EVLDPLAEAIGIVEQQALQRGIVIAVHDDLGAQVRADRRALRQVFVNLLSNAVKFNREYGTVHVSVREGARVQVSVRDSGTGLTREQIARLFQPFERLGAEHSGIAGHGLGLAVCRELVAAMRGSIDVVSDTLDCTVTPASLSWLYEPIRKPVGPAGAVKPTIRLRRESPRASRPVP